MSDYAVALVGKIMCYAICALAMDLIWGYTGILSLGHGLFFALGGYAMGMYLMRQIGRDGNYKSDLPDFMVFLDWKELPWHWTFSDSFIATLFLIVAVPGLVAFVFGYFAFRSRIKGVYFSIITQAMTFAAMLLFFRNETGFGGNNGFTDFKRILGMPVATPSMRMTLFVLTGLTLLGCFLFARWLVRSKFGRVLQAIRDAETRVMFRATTRWLQAHDLDHLGHHVRRGRRAVCAAGGHHQPRRNEPGQLDRDRHLGGRGRTRHADRADRRRLHRQRRQELADRDRAGVLAVLPGALFIAVTLFLPNGVVGLVKKLKEEVKMTPDLMEEGARRFARRARQARSTGQDRIRRPRRASRASPHRARWTPPTAASCTWKM
jgi:urea transport system permease protein